MKKLLFIALIGIATATMAVQMIGNGKRVLFKFPVGIAEHREYLFPTFNLESRNYTANDTVEVRELQTYLKVDTLKGTYNVVLNVQSHVLPGATFYVQFGNNDTTRTAYIKQGSNIIDTISVNGNNIKRWYLYNGNKYEKF